MCVSRQFDVLDALSYIEKIHIQTSQLDSTASLYWPSSYSISHVEYSFYMNDAISYNLLIHFIMIKFIIIFGTYPFFSFSLTTFPAICLPSVFAYCSPVCRLLPRFDAKNEREIWIASAKCENKRTTKTKSILALAIDYCSTQTHLKSIAYFDEQPKVL